METPVEPIFAACLLGLDHTFAVDPVFVDKCPGKAGGTFGSICGQRLAVVEGPLARPKIKNVAALKQRIEDPLSMLL